MLRILPDSQSVTHPAINLNGMADIIEELMKGTYDGQQGRQWLRERITRTGLTHHEAGAVADLYDRLCQQQATLSLTHIDPNTW
jgi:hypothetical protein